MSFFRALFGQKKKEEEPKISITPPRVSQVINAIQDLEIRESQISKKIEHLRKLCANLKIQAREALAVNPNSPIQKSIAERYIKKMKMYEKEISSLTSAEERITEQRIMIETQSMQVDTISVMNKANRVIPKNDPDAIADVMDEINDKIRDTEEINDLLARPIGTTVDISDEMAELMEEVTPVAVAAPVAVSSEPVVAPLPEFPVVPTTIPTTPLISTPAKVKRDISFERQLAELENA
jgi:hypothetical protein